jgi:hypothetical protein
MLPHHETCRLKEKEKNKKAKEGEVTARMAWIVNEGARKHQIRSCGRQVSSNSRKQGGRGKAAL